jgi:hypothetical protein
VVHTNDIHVRIKCSLAKKELDGDCQMKYRLGHILGKEDRRWSIKEVRRRLNKILTKVSNKEMIRRRKMEKKSSEKTKPKTERVRFNLKPPNTGRVSLTGDVNGCVLVIPEIFRMNEHIMLYQDRLPEYHL